MRVQTAVPLKRENLEHHYWADEDGEENKSNDCCMWSTCAIKKAALMHNSPHLPQLGTDDIYVQWLDIPINQSLLTLLPARSSSKVLSWFSWTPTCFSHLSRLPCLAGWWVIVSTKYPLHSVFLLGIFVCSQSGPNLAINHIWKFINLYFWPPNTRLTNLYCFSSQFRLLKNSKITAFQNLKNS